MKKETLTVAKDLILFGGGLAGLAHMQINSDNSIPRLVVYFLMITGAGATHLPALIAAYRSGTVPQLSQAPQQQELSQSQSSSGNASTKDGQDGGTQ